MAGSIDLGMLKGNRQPALAIARRRRSDPGVAIADPDSLRLRLAMTSLFGCNGQQSTGANQQKSHA